MHFKPILFILLFLQASLSFSQVSGRLMGSLEDRNEILVGANLFWQGTQTGATTDANGYFSLENPERYPATLIVSYVGYKSDTIELAGPNSNLNIELKPSGQLSTVEVKGKLEATRLSIHSEFHQETLTTKELQKAACCNVSESFETNASIDLSIGDAISGAKRIQMLGLDGKYTQIQFENIPLARGLVANTGLNFIPGTWVESIQVTKGTGSVING